MILEQTVLKFKNGNVRYVPLTELKKQIVLAVAQSGNAKVIWTKSSPMQPDKLRQILLIQGKKYMAHFWKNKVTDIYLLERI